MKAEGRGRQKQEDSLGDWNPVWGEKLELTDSTNIMDTDNMPKKWVSAFP